ncbi:hypothetical protein KIPB_010209 [Kipferlia bialata]|uniref:Uncharacterized protein n=1 Tax=Kipferlia bialata TaxID=797122 RepID=A0A9K3GMN8_9EUKA|nr:hypothetical protein KIPB_010209 [Kipferlia bialata]|eukprot:g10209.t1
MASIIGLSIRTKLARSLPLRFSVTVTCMTGTHNDAETLTKQINDKERATAALTNKRLLSVINQCIGEWEG